MANHNAMVIAILHHSDAKAEWYIELWINGVRVYDTAYGALDHILRRVIEMDVDCVVHPGDVQRYIAHAARINDDGGIPWGKLFEPGLVKRPISLAPRVLNVDTPARLSPAC